MIARLPPVARLITKSGKAIASAHRPSRSRWQRDRMAHQRQRSFPMRRRWSRMEARVAAIRAGTRAELVWLLEHPPLYTAGTSAQDRGSGRCPTLAGVPHRPRRPIHLSRARASAWPMSCSTCKRRGADVRALCARTRGMADPHALAASASRASAARAGSASGSDRKAAAARTRSPPSACACATGSASTASSLNVDPDLEPLPRHRALRHPRTRRDLAGGARRHAVHGRGRCRPQSSLWRGIRRWRQTRARLWPRRGTGLARSGCACLRVMPMIVRMLVFALSLLLPVLAATADAQTRTPPTSRTETSPVLCARW